MKLHVAASAAADEKVAARDTVERVLREADAPAFALVLSTDQYDPQALATALTHELGAVPWAGFSGAGVFAGAELLMRGIVVGLFSTLDVKFGIGVGGPVSRDARGAGRDAAAQAISSLPPLDRGRCRSVMVFPDGLTGNSAEVIRGAAQETGAGVVWAGGGAGDNLRFVRAAQFARGVAYRDHVVAVVMDTPHRVGLGVRHGFRPYGPPRLVTRASGATAIELEYERAFDVYRDSADAHGDHVDEAGFASFAMTHPLGIPQADGEHVIRDPLAVEPDGGLRCVAEVPDGALVRVMQAGRSELIAAARLASVDARAGLEGPPAGAVVFDCVSRAKLLGGRVRDE
ncbi:MAG: FIST signal transduction protein, partial [Polyangiales bacterium]